MAFECSQPRIHYDYHSQSTTSFRCPIRRRISFRRRRRPTVRLGGGKKKENLKPCRGLFLGRVFWNRSVKMRSLKNKYCCMVKKIKGYCGSVVKESIGMESLKQRMVLDSPFATPVIGHSFRSLSPLFHSC